MAAPTVILRPQLHWRVGAVILVLGGTYLAYSWIAAGVVTVKLVVLCAALLVGGIPILYLSWVGGYAVDGRGIKRKLTPGLPSPSVPYAVLWREPIRVHITDHGIIGKSLDLRNVRGEKRVMVSESYTGLGHLLEQIREHAASFDERSLRAAEDYLDRLPAEAV